MSFGKFFESCIGIPNKLTEHNPEHTRISHNGGADDEREGNGPHNLTSVPAVGPGIVQGVQNFSFLFCFISVALKANFEITASDVLGE